jgi:hypothetical protein
MGEDGAHDSASKSASDGQQVGLGAMFTRDAISPIEVAGCVTFPQEPVQSDSMNRAFSERRGAVR